VLEPLESCLCFLPMCSSILFLAICLLFKVTFVNQPEVNFFTGRISDLIMLSLKLKASGGVFFFHFGITVKRYSEVKELCLLGLIW